MACLFCRIIEKSEPSTIIYEDDSFFCFLDKRPLFYGHSLLCPKSHYETMYDLPDELLAHFFIKAKQIGQAIEKGMNAAGSFIAINNRISQSVPHIHVHLVPRNKKDGLKGFFWPRTTYQTEEQRQTIQQLIIRQLNLAKK